MNDKSFRNIFWFIMAVMPGAFMLTSHLCGLSLYFGGLLSLFLPIFLYFFILITEPDFARGSKGSLLLSLSLASYGFYLITLTGLAASVDVWLGNLR